MLDWLDLPKLVREMLDPQATPPAGPEQLTVLGGEFPASRLEMFLQAWALPRDGMPWSLWQWTDDIRLDHGAGLPTDLDYLERGRVFGSAGDLELRREQGRFLWRFVGPSTPPPLPGFDVDNYWDHPLAAPLRPYERTALLWGNRQAARNLNKAGWHDDRVGWARLDYPNVQGERVQVRYREYLRGSRVELVQLLGLEEAPARAAGGHHG